MTTKQRRPITPTQAIEKQEKESLIFQNEFCNNKKTNLPNTFCGGGVRITPRCAYFCIISIFLALVVATEMNYFFPFHKNKNNNNHGILEGEKTIPKKEEPDLIIHIGLPKTGTTSIQGAFGYYIYNSLLDDNYHYLGKTRISPSEMAKNYIKIKGLVGEEDPTTTSMETANNSNTNNNDSNNMMMEQKLVIQQQKREKQRIQGRTQQATAAAAGGNIRRILQQEQQKGSDASNNAITMRQQPTQQQQPLISNLNRKNNIMDYYDIDSNRNSENSQTINLNGLSREDRDAIMAIVRGERTRGGSPVRQQILDETGERTRGGSPVRQKVLDGSANFKLKDKFSIFAQKHNCVFPRKNINKYSLNGGISLDDEFGGGGGRRPPPGGWGSGRRPGGGGGRRRPGGGGGGRLPGGGRRPGGGGVRRPGGGGGFGRRPEVGGGIGRRGGGRRRLGGVGRRPNKDNDKCSYNVRHPDTQAFIDLLQYHYKRGHNIIISEEFLSALTDVGIEFLADVIINNTGYKNPRIIVTSRYYYEWAASWIQQFFRYGSWNSDWFSVFPDKNGVYIPSIPEMTLNTTTNKTQKLHYNTYCTFEPCDWSYVVTNNPSADYNDYDDYSPPALNLANKFYKYFKNVEIFNFNQKNGTLIENFVCQIIPRATKTCASLSASSSSAAALLVPDDMNSDEHDNEEDDEEYDDFNSNNIGDIPILNEAMPRERLDYQYLLQAAYEKYQLGTKYDGISSLRPKMIAYVSQYHHILSGCPGRLVDPRRTSRCEKIIPFPLLCMTNDEKSALIEKTVALEKKMFANPTTTVVQLPINNIDEYDNNNVERSKWGWKNKNNKADADIYDFLRSIAREKLEKDKYCIVDVDKTLDGPKWDYFFQTQLPQSLGYDVVH